MGALEAGDDLAERGRNPLAIKHLEFFDGTDRFHDVSLAS